MGTVSQALEGVPNGRQPSPNLVTGGQPTQANLESLKAAGVGTVLDLRDPMEPRPYDEPALVRDLGMTYVNVPVGSGTLSDATMDRILEVVRGSGDRPVFVHCGSGNRVGAALLPYFMIDKGLDEEEAIAQAMRVGLRSAEMLEWGLDYARRRPPPP